LLAAIYCEVFTFIVDLSSGSGFDRYLMSPDCVGEISRDFDLVASSMARMILATPFSFAVFIVT
jgi:hypothetical protein